MRNFILFLFLEKGKILYQVGINQEQENVRCVSSTMSSTTFLHYGNNNTKGIQHVIWLLIVRYMANQILELNANIPTCTSQSIHGVNACFPRLNDKWTVNWPVASYMHAARSQHYQTRMCSGGLGLLVQVYTNWIRCHHLGSRAIQQSSTSPLSISKTKFSPIGTSLPALRLREPLSYLEQLQYMMLKLGTCTCLSAKAQGTNFPNEDQQPYKKTALNWKGKKNVTAASLSC